MDPTPWLIAVDLDFQLSRGRPRWALCVCRAVDGNVTGRCDVWCDVDKSSPYDVVVMMKELMSERSFQVLCERRYFFCRPPIDVFLWAVFAMRK